MNPDLKISKSGAGQGSFRLFVIPYLSIFSSNFTLLTKAFESNHWANWKCQTRCIQMHSMSLAHISTFDISPKASMETLKKSQHVIIFASFVLFSLFRLCYPCYQFYISFVCTCLLVVLFLFVYVKLIASCYCSLLFVCLFVCCLLSYVMVFLHISTCFKMFLLFKIKAPPDAFSGQIEGVTYLAGNGLGHGLVMLASV